jgi:formamidopyrimidine-DNA glycosylase
MARLLGPAAKGSEVRSVTIGGVGTLKSFDPEIETLVGQKITRIRRRGKHLVVDFSGDVSLLVHLMSAGRLQIFDKTGSVRDKINRLMIRLDDGRDLRLREFGSKQRAWVKLVLTKELEDDPALSDLGPDAWPDPPEFKALLDGPRPLHAILRDQKVIAGIGRSWVDEILHSVKMSPFKRGDSLTDDEAEQLRSATIGCMKDAIAHYENVLELPLPDKLPMPLTVHRRKGQPCPRCGTALEAVHFEEHEMCYCPSCQTEGKLLKDRRLSRLLK